jgi:hypothetical protein
MTAADDVVFLLECDDTLRNYDLPALLRSAGAVGGEQETT